MKREIQLPKPEFLSEESPLIVSLLMGLSVKRLSGPLRWSVVRAVDFWESWVRVDRKARVEAPGSITRIARNYNLPRTVRSLPRSRCLL
jgi:hypothetical protein